MVIQQSGDYQNREFTQLDVRGQDLSNSQFQNSRFEAVDFSGANLQGADFTNVLCRNCRFTGADLSNSRLIGADLQGCDLSQVRLSGANLYTAMLAKANLTGVTADERTAFFHLRCPETGAFLAYKKCFDFRIVQLLIPADAKRSSATNVTCRCDKAKVLTIKSVDRSETYVEAVSYVDENFVYTVGDTIEAGNYDEDRWADSTGGIHFFMTRAEALGYM